MTTAAAIVDPLTPISISSASPAVVTVDATGSIAENDLIVIAAGATGMTSLDGRSFVAVNIGEDSFELLGTDTTNETYAPGPAPTLDHYDTASTVILCLSGLTRNAGSTSTTSVGTYCDPTATLANPVVEAGTFDFTGYIDTSDPGFRELTLAYDDGDARHFAVYLPGDNGAIVFDGTVSSFDYDLPVDGALGYSGSITLAGRPRHLFE